MSSQLPSTVESFIKYLNGEKIVEYDGTGTAVADFLTKTITNTLRLELTQKEGSAFRWQSVAPINVGRLGQLLRTILNDVISVLPELNVRSSVIKAFEAWDIEFNNTVVENINAFANFKTKLHEIVNNIEILRGLLRNSQGDLSSCKSAFDEVINSIRRYFSGHLEYLDDREKRLLSSRAYGQMNAQDPMKPKLEYSAWFEAWKQPFRGTALDSLETKIARNLQALMQKESGKTQMSRIIPIVQSSGTGKSRLAEEYVRKNFAVMLSLRNGEGFPFCDPFVSEYFKDLLRLNVRFNAETPRDPQNLGAIDDVDKENARKKLKDDFYQESNPTYRPQSRWKTPSSTSIPETWEAAGRLRFTCFLAGLFHVMVQYVKRSGFNTVENWRSQLLHSKDNDENRRLFWYNVVRFALRLLRKDNIKILKEWTHLHADSPLHSLNNAEINEALKKILSPHINAFFDHPLITTFINCSVSGKGSALPFLFIIDEAAYLYQTNYMHAAMWVLDQTVVDILAGRKDVGKFFVLMLGTHSQISHFAPDYAYPSQRVFEGAQFIPSIFISLGWDSGVTFPPQRSHRLDESAHIRNLVKWGRPCWLSLFKGLKESDDETRLWHCIGYGIDKLLPLGSDSDELLSTFAVLALRLHLDFDFVFPSRANKLVSSKMRWLVDVDSWRKHLVTTYGSEPILVEAAACIMNSPLLFKNKSNPLAEFISKLESELNLGHVDRGRNGELTARILLILAKDQATRELWWRDQRFLQIMNIQPIQDFWDPNGEYQKRYFLQETRLYYGGRPPSPIAFYHRAVSVKHFLQTLLDPDVYSSLAKHFENQPKWKSLDNAYVNFSHFAPVMDGHDGVAFTKLGFYGGWERHCAYFLGKQNFAAVDIVIPMAFSWGGCIDEESVTYIVISMKSRSGTERIKADFLTRDSVEGVRQKKKATKQSTSDPSVPANKEYYITACDKSIINLTLHSLTFINPEGTIGEMEWPDSTWIETSEEKPYIAFVMTMGNTDRTDKLFIAEKNETYNTNRIVFAVRGLMNSYQIHKDMKEIIRNINIRHDASGRYPQTGFDYPEEEPILLEARKPLDDLHAFLWNSGSGSDPGSDHSSERASDQWITNTSDDEEGRMELDQTS